jgi:hypothetical protein
MSTLRRDRFPYLTSVPSFLLPEARNTYYYQSYQPHIPIITRVTSHVYLLLPELPATYTYYYQSYQPRIPIITRVTSHVYLLLPELPAMYTYYYQSYQPRIPIITRVTSHVSARQTSLMCCGIEMNSDSRGLLLRSYYVGL